MASTSAQVLSNPMTGLVQSVKDPFIIENKSEAIANHISSPIDNDISSVIARLKAETEHYQNEIKMLNDSLKIVNSEIECKQRMAKMNSTAKMKKDLWAVLSHKDVCTGVLDLQLQNILRSTNTSKFSAQVMDFSLRLNDISSISYYYVFETFGWLLPSEGTLHRNSRKSKKKNINNRKELIDEDMKEKKIKNNQKKDMHDGNEKHDDNEEFIDEEFIDITNYMK